MQGIGAEGAVVRLETSSSRASVVKSEDDGERPELQVRCGVLVVCGGEEGRCGITCAGVGEVFKQMSLGSAR